MSKETKKNNDDLFDSLDSESIFERLVYEVANCTVCPRMVHVQRVLSHSNGPIDANIMFVGEAPGRLGADQSQIPFHGDKSGHNFEALLDQVGIDRYNSFVTNAVLCNPRDKAGNNSPPTISEVRSCASFLRRQIEVVNPRIIVPLGGKALTALSFIESHNLNLKSHVRTKHDWYQRILIPTYHPGQRAMIHRSFANQLADYQFIAEEFRRLDVKKRNFKSSKNAHALSIVSEIIRIKPIVTYFAIHKLFYLIEYKCMELLGHRITNAYIIRQKDGPYCTDLHIFKLQKELDGVRIVNEKGRLTISRVDAGFFPSEFEREQFLNADEKGIIRQVVEKYGNLSDAKLKTAVYMSKPMREVLKKEKSDRKNLFNFPLLSPNN